MDKCGSQATAMLKISPITHFKLQTDGQTLMISQSMVHRLGKELSSQPKPSHAPFSALPAIKPNSHRSNSSNSGTRVRVSRLKALHPSCHWLSA